MDDLAKCVIMIAALGGMPGTFFQTDSRVALACSTLGWTTYEAQEWAEREIEANDPVGWTP